MAIFDGASEAAIRLAAFAGIFLIMALLELALPRRRLRYSKARRWFTNVAVGAIDSLIVRLMGAFVVPLAAVSTALYVEAQGWGLFNWLDWPVWLEITLAVILLDLAIYGQHVASHKIPVLWLLHRVHHSDVDFDVTTAVRFHPVEIALSMLYKIVLVLILGPAPVAVVIFEIILNGCAMFNHANLALPGWLDRSLRLILVTPDMHRVHHSVIHAEHDTNYGFNLSIWDRIFGTYKAQPAKGHEQMRIGLEPWQDSRPTRLDWALLLPFREPDSTASATGSQAQEAAKTREA